MPSGKMYTYTFYMSIYVVTYIVIDTHMAVIETETKIEVDCIQERKGKEMKGKKRKGKKRKGKERKGKKRKGNTVNTICK